MRIALWLLAAGAALPASAAVSLDPATGLWFPPYASPAQYLRRDADHPYIRDVRKAFAEKPELAQEVCSAVLANTADPPADPSVKQLRAVLQITCVVRRSAELMETADREQQSRAAAQLSAIFAEEEAAASSVPEAQRDALAEELLERVRNGGEGVLRPALRAIALEPYYTYPPAELLRIDYALRDGGASFTHAQLAQFVEELYRTRAASDHAGARQWQRGLPAILLFNGRIDEARQAAAAWLRDAPDENRGYAIAMQAAADAAAGDRAALRQLTTNCPASAAWRAEHGGNPNGYCVFAATMLVINALEVQRDRAPRGIVSAAFELADMQKDDWPSRLSLTSAAMRAAPDKAASRFYDMLSEKEIPPGAQLDAVYYLAKLAATNDPASAAPLYDCWLSLHGVRMPPLPDDAWATLAAMPERAAHASGDCFAPGQRDVDSWCVMHALQVREQSAIEAKQWDVAQQSVEMLLAMTLAAGGSPSPVRDALYNLAAQEADAGRQKEAGAIIGYLMRQPHDAYIGSQIGRFVNIAHDEQQPWNAPTLIDATRLPQQCPPPRPLKHAQASAMAAPSSDHTYAVTGAAICVVALLGCIAAVRKRG